MTDPAKEQLDPKHEDHAPDHHSVRDPRARSAEAEGESMEERLASAEAEAETHLNDLKRLAAEFENYRKRVAREQQALSTRAAERLVKELLPIVDDLGRALEAAEAHEEAKLEEGVRLVHRQLESVLEREGLAEISEVAQVEVLEIDVPAGKAAAPVRGAEGVVLLALLGVREQVVRA
ncbi:MAG TPA: nucleotide exchange factor GrpE, partial [Gaiellaceae bacterium]|nr:nucleotide exchange factor GrpE [Gaiellaceae bacterium]